MVEYIQRNDNPNFTLALIELPVYRKPDAGKLLITPRILSRTVEIERVLFRTVELATATTDERKIILEKAFFERLSDTIGRQKVYVFESFVLELSSNLNILPRLGNGKKLSLNPKSADD
jgi:hypothetical protein